MFLGHFAVGFAAKKFSPKISLGTLFAAALWLDILWPFLVLAGIEKFSVVPGTTRMSPFEFLDYPISHSLAMTLAWAAGAGLIALILGKDSKVATVIAALVASHWALDFLVHKPDLPIFPYGGNVRVGLSLWNSMVGTILLELVLFGFGFWIYMTSTKARNKGGAIGMFALGAVLLACYLSSLKYPPPDNTNLIAAMGEALELIMIAAAFWVDDQRREA